MPIQLAMVGVVVSDMARSLAFYRRLGLAIPDEEDGKRFVMHRMASGVTIFFDSIFFTENDPGRTPSPRGSYNISLEFYAGTREAVDRLYADLTGEGYVGRRPPWKSAGPYAAIVEDPDGNPILITAEDPSAEI
jgi:catechol 2,3-dioxygenase-like lactoylglutathione lyase family enzyme